MHQITIALTYLNATAKQLLVFVATTSPTAHLFLFMMFSLVQDEIWTPLQQPIHTSSHRGVKTSYMKQQISQQPETECVSAKRPQHERGQSNDLGPDQSSLGSWWGLLFQSGRGSLVGSSHGCMAHLPSNCKQVRGNFLTVEREMRSRHHHSASHAITPQPLTSQRRATRGGCGSYSLHPPER